jgi:16S rRNA G1207 methylase RsmC
MRISVLLFVMCLTVAAQSREQVEAQISQLPADRQAYERYRFRITTQPQEIQSAPNQLTTYREYLKTNGFSEREIEAQISVISEQGKRLEVERWNQILTAAQPRFNTAPNMFFVDMVKARRPGTALDVGMSQGRNAIWLAQQGWEVTGFDPADKAVGLARQNAEKLAVKLRTEVKGSEDFDFRGQRLGPDRALVCRRARGR